MGDWTYSETVSNPDGSVETHFCDECGYMTTREHAEIADDCPSCGYDGGEEDE